MLTKEVAKTDLKIEIENALEDFFIFNIKKSRDVGKDYETLWNELHRLIKSGGKRTRPQLMLLSYSAFGGIEINSVIKIAAALELFHQSLLISDDVIDRDSTRYGVPNISGGYREIYKELIDNKVDREHHSDSAAILASSLMLSSSYRLINESDIDGPKKNTVNDIFNEACFEVGGGELLDIESSYREISMENALSIARYKTAGYSFIAPILIGAILADASDSDIELLRLFAGNLGKAFQINDDLLGMFGDESKTGKSNSTDMREGKGTYLVATFLDNASKKEKDVFKKAFGISNASLDAIEAAKSILVSSGAKSRTEAKVVEFEGLATAALNNLEIDLVYKKEYSKLIDKCLRSHR